MPSYTLECDACGSRYQIKHKMTEGHPATCQQVIDGEIVGELERSSVLHNGSCSGKLNRKFRPTNFRI